MPTYQLTVSYDGQAYAGWQVQHNANTIQAELEAAIHSVTGQSVRIIGSGRTDAGVHALAQVASMTLDSRLPEDRLLRALNGVLPEDIRINQLRVVDASFHAQRDAVAKRYRYVLQDGRVLDVFHRQRAWFVRHPLDLAAMQSAARALVGRHDFASFQAAGSPRASTVRDVMHLSLSRPPHAPQLIWLEIEGNGFLYNMVRNIVGTLVEVGRGKRSAASVEQLLSQRDRKCAGPTAPAHGLFLVEVRYDAATEDR